MKSTVLPVCALLLMSLNCASGAVLMSTLGQTPVGVPGLSVIATDFTTGGSTTILSQLTLAISNTGPNAETFLQGGAMILADLAGAPDMAGWLGSFLGPITAPANSGLQNYTVTNPGITLQPNTTYWLAMFSNAPPLGGAGIETALNQFANPGAQYSTVPGTQLKSSSNFGASWFDVANTTPLYELQGTSVPEPSRALLVLCGLFGIMFNRRRLR